jgi:hypothetical protein
MGKPLSAAERQLYFSEILVGFAEEERGGKAHLSVAKVVSYMKRHRSAQYYDDETLPKHVYRYLIKEIDPLFDGEAFPPTERLLKRAQEALGRAKLAEKREIMKADGHSEDKIEKWLKPSMKVG